MPVTEPASPAAKPPAAEPTGGVGLPAVGPPAAGPPGGVGPPGVARGGRRWWLIGVAAGWALLLLGLSIVSAHRDRATVLEQRDLAAAVPAVDRAAGAVSAAAQAADVVVTIGPLTVNRACQVTPVRAGAEAARDVVVHVRPGGGGAALDAIADRLPAAYDATVHRRRAGAVHVLRADAGEFVAVQGLLSADGTVVTVRAASGCRPIDGAADPTEPPAGPLPPVLTAALAALKLTPGPAVAHEVGCPAGGVARTVVVRASSAPAVLAQSLGTVTADATVVQSGPTRYAYRVDADSVVVDVSGEQVRIAATSAC